MTCADFGPIAEGVLSRLHTAEIEQDPFPHLVLTDAFPAEYYRQIVEQLPVAGAFARAEYPGTGRFTLRHGGRPTPEQSVDHHGLVLRDWSAIPFLGSLNGFFKDDAFSRTLLHRFSDSRSRDGEPAIPVAKHGLFKEGNCRYTCAFALHKDLPGYEISPHVDHPAKIVTFLWYLEDDRSNPCGTLLCRPKPGVDVAALSTANYESAKREDRSGLWLDWDKFDVVKEVGGPNVLLAFAPNEISFHGVRLSMSDRPCERTVVRGFIARKGYADTRVIASA